MKSETETAGLLVEIIKPPYGDCSNGGLSHDHSAAVLVGERFGMSPVTAEVPAVKLVRDKVMGKPRIYATPANAARYAGQCGPMFGGCFIWSEDSRFPSENPIKLFDRWETQKQYNDMTRD